MNNSRDPSHQIFALAVWLQSFPQFDLQIYADRSQEDDFNYFKQQEEAKRLLSTLRGPEATLAVCQVAEDICGEQIDVSHIDNRKNGVDEIWNTLYLMTSARARSIQLDQCASDISASSSTDSLNSNLQLRVLSELLDCAVQATDKSKRRDYIGRIMKLNNITQKVIMGMIEQRSPTRGPRSATKNKPRPQNRTGTKNKSPIRHQSPVKTLKSASAYNISSGSRRSSPTKSKPATTSPPPSLRSSSMHQSPCGDPGQVMARMNCSNGGGVLPNGTGATNELSQNLFGASPPPQQPTKSTFQETPTVTRQARSSMIPQQRAVAFQESPGFLSPGTMESPQRLQSIIQKLQRTTEIQQQSLDAKKATEESLKQQIEKSEQDHRKAMIKVESEAYDRLQEVQISMEQQIGELKEKLETATDEARVGNSAISELRVLKEEMEVMQSNKTALADTNEKLNKYRERLAEMADLKDALDREQHAHGRAVDEIVRLEQEVQQLNPVKRQVEDYKIRAIEAEVKLVECQDHLKRLEKHASAENSQLFKDILMQKGQMEELRHRIQHEVSASSSNEGPGIGEGISELNPELKEELTRLRNENYQLRAFQAKRNEDAVQHLEESLDDCERMMEKYKAEYLDTKDTLSKTSTELQRVQQQNDDLQSESHHYKEQCTQYSQRCERLESRLELTSKQLEQTGLSLHNAEQANEKLNTELNHWIQSKQECDECIEKQQHDLRGLQEIVDKSKSTVRILQDEVQRLQNNCDEGSKTNKELREEMEELAREHDETLTRLAEKERNLGHLNERASNLKQEVDKLEQCLKEEQDQRESEAAVARASLESTQRELLAKHKQEMDEFEHKLSSTLEKEQIENLARQNDLELKLEKCEDKWRSRYQDLQDQSNHTIQQSRQENEERINTLTNDFNTAVTKIQSEGKQKQQDLVKKGKQLMEQAKSKASDEFCRLHTQIEDVERKCREVMAEKEEIESHLQNQLQQTRGLLNAAHQETETRTRDLDAAEAKMKNLEREVYKLNNENAHFRKIFGSQNGATSETQAQLTKLRAEFASVVEENRQLQKQNCGRAVEEIDDGKPYRNRAGRMGAQAINELRRDFQEQIAKLNEDKRDLIMEVSSQKTELARGAQAQSDYEQEIKRIKNEKTNLELRLQRVELEHEGRRSMSPSKAAQYNSPSRIPRASPGKVHRSSPSIDRAKRQKAAQEHLLRSRFSSITGVQKPKEPRNSHAANEAVLPTPIDPNGEEEDEDPGSPPKKASEVFRVKVSPSAKRQLPSIVQVTQPPEEENGDSTPECKQS